MKVYHRIAATACAGLALVAVKPAKADTIVENFTVSGTAVEDNGLFGITSSSFADFNTAAGTLTGVTLSFSGTANYSESVNSGDITIFSGVTTASNVHIQFFSGSGQGSGGPFAISASGTATSDLSLFEGGGTQALVFGFLLTVGTVTMSDQSGTLTYDYTPAAPPTNVPEPGSLSLFGAGLAGLLFLGRSGFWRRKALA